MNVSPRSVIFHEGPVWLAHGSMWGNLGREGFCGLGSRAASR
jgi:hypothetical protein